MINVLVYLIKQSISYNEVLLAELLYYDIRGLPQGNILATILFFTLLISQKSIINCYHELYLALLLFLMRIIKCMVMDINSE